MSASLVSRCNYYLASTATLIYTTFILLYTGKLSNSSYCGMPFISLMSAVWIGGLYPVHKCRFNEFMGVSKCNIRTSMHNYYCAGGFKVKHICTCIVSSAQNRKAQNTPVAIAYNQSGPFYSEPIESAATYI
jgi:hypothetical protein